MHASPWRCAHARQLALVLAALQQVVVRLQRHIGGDAVALAETQRLFQTRRAVVGGGRVERILPSSISSPNAPSVSSSGVSGSSLWA